MSRLRVPEPAFLLSVWNVRYRPVSRFFTTVMGMKIRITPFAWVCFSMCVGVMGTALISPLYALYKQGWQLSNSDVTLVYTAYMGGAFFGLMCLGRLPDKMGFLSVMKKGLMLMGIGTLASMLASNVLILDGGRFMVGIASSMLTTSASVGLVQLSVKNGNLQRAATIHGERSLFQNVTAR